MNNITSNITNLRVNRNGNCADHDLVNKME